MSFILLFDRELRRLLCSPSRGYPAKPQNPSIVSTKQCQRGKDGQTCCRLEDDSPETFADAFHQAD